MPTDLIVRRKPRQSRQPKTKTRQDKMNSASILEAEMLPILKEHAEILSQRYRHLKVNTWSSCVGGNTELQGHNLGIECLNHNVASNETDNIALCIGIKHITTDPKFFECDVCWGHPSGHVVIDCMESDLPFNKDTLDHIKGLLPKLIEALDLSLKDWVSSK